MTQKWKPVRIFSLTAGGPVLTILDSQGLHTDVRLLRSIVAYEQVTSQHLRGIGKGAPSVVITDRSCAGTQQHALPPKAM